jgi:ribose 5-phosphate isomerase A
MTTGRNEMTPDTAAFKRQAAAFAVEFVQSGMVVGLGHGSTAIIAIGLIAKKIETGALKDIVGIPCSLQAEEEARRFKIPVATLEDHSSIDITIDGADEVDPYLNLIKGAGGALLKEKIVAQASHREVIVVDESKIVQTLGEKRPVPVEVIPFGWYSQSAYLKSLGAQVSARRNSNGSFFLTDQGNLVLDCSFGPLQDAYELAGRIKERAGIVEHGIFLGMATDVIVAGPGGIRHLKP